MKRFKIAIISIICSLTLTGCWDKQELENNTFVILLGIDKAEDENISITIAFPLTQSNTSSDEKSENNGDSGEYTTLSVKAPSLIEGLNIFSTTLAGPIALYSVKTIVISRELAQDEMLRHLFSSWRYEEIRNTINILVSEGKSSEFIEARIKNSPINPLRQEELLLEQSNYGAYYKSVQLLEFISNLKSGTGDCVTMYGGVIPSDDGDSEDENNSENSGKNDEIRIDNMVKNGYLPSEIPIDSENKSKVSGLAVFRAGKMIGVLDSDETQTFSIFILNNTKKILTLPDPLDPESNIVISVMPGGNKSIKSSIENGTPIFYIDIKLKSSIESIQSQIDYAQPENFEVLRKYIESVCFERIHKLILKSQKEYNADIFKLGDKLAHNFLTTREWENYNWAEKYKDAKINLDINLKIDGTGIMIP